MTTALVSHLVRQGKYGSNDIAVLTPYLGQFTRIQRKLADLFAIRMDDSACAHAPFLCEDPADLVFHIWYSTRIPAYCWVNLLFEKILNSTSLTPLPEEED